ncbi:protein-disulfide isomerase (plasmid) [Alloyangia pacifica]|uniref:Protein-disulfide isomerase n=1 Tax=Alloyangia pacifica TaxID=311180 RepID=A0A2U8HK80_9RHOB|nr:DsbA family protein [Alloyangia pacifica]AWI85960.1 protein-disulfide isomerase [Alloyangia pacifica]
MTPNTRFTYLFDPLCGWCYAAAPALKRLAETHGDRLRLMPTGLFVDPRPVAAIADHARKNDGRIEALTGQPFTDAYHQGIMRARGGVFSSQALTRALVAIGSIDPALEPRFLHAAQTARYVEGRDTSRSEVVAGVAVEVAQATGKEIDEAAFRVKITDDPALDIETDRRIAEGKKVMAALGLQGIPQLIVTDDRGVRAVDSQALYAGGAAVLAAIWERA